MAKYSTLRSKVIAKIRSLEGRNIKLSEYLRIEIDSDGRPHITISTDEVVIRDTDGRH